MKYNNSNSIVGWSDEERNRIQKLAKEAEMKQEQRQQLEKQIEARLESEIANFRQELQLNYKLPESAQEILYIKDIILRDFNGKSQQALSSRLESNWAKLNGAQMDWSLFINSFGTASTLSRFFRSF